MREANKQVYLRLLSNNHSFKHDFRKHLFIVRIVPMHKHGLSRGAAFVSVTFSILSNE